MPTIAHEIGRIGYKTVLIGRMHFKGADQKHGFDMRLAGDITSQYWGTGGKSRSDFGAYAGTTNRRHCLEAVGGGYSPVMAYDAHVFETAMEYLKHCPRDGRGIFLVVGFYSPHFLKQRSAAGSCRLRRLRFIGNTFSNAPRSI